MTSTLVPRAPESATSDPLIDRCMLCGQEVRVSSRPYFDTRFGYAEHYGIARCSTCGLEQTLPRPDIDTLKSLYERYYNFGGEKGTRYSTWRERFLRSSLYRLWLIFDGDVSFHAHKGSGRLLDVGCNEGRGLFLYQANGYTPEGLEFNKEAAAVAQAAGFTVYTLPLEQLHPKAPYDVIVLSNVLEHVLSPRDMLAQVHRLLVPGGQVWISCPNKRSFWRMVFGTAWINWHVPFHLAHFSFKTLQQLMQQSGFERIREDEVTPSLWVTQSLIAALFSRFGRPTRQLRSAILVAPLILVTRFLLFPLLIVANHTDRGDCLRFMARKV